MDLIEKIKERKAKIAIIGGGYVGLPEAVECAKKRFLTTVFDIKPERVDKINKGENYIGDVKEEELKDMIQLKRLKATSNFSELKEQDIICICVPTPLKESLEPEMKYIEITAYNIKENLQKGQLIILESTTYPGTTRDFLKPILEQSGLKAGEDFFLSFSPERVDPGNTKFKYQDITKVIGGINQESTKTTKAFYDIITENNTHSVNTCEEAEFTKILENVYRSVNVGLANELQLVAEKMGVNFWNVIESAKTKPYGFQAFYPGPGLGGHCFEKNHKIWVKEDNKIKIMKIKEIYDKYAQKKIKITKPKKKIEVLSYNIKKNKIEFNKITHLSKRKTEEIIEIKTPYNHQLKITDLHPVITYKNNQLKTKYAKDLTINDNLVFSRLLMSSNKPFSINIINIIKDNKELIKKVRITCKKENLYKIKKLIKAEYKRKDKFYDFTKGEYLPLELFLKFEKKLALSQKKLKLHTGKGPSLTTIPNHLPINKDFCRLMGYYLSEGCQTIEKKTRRIRFTFHKDEKEYIGDVKKILEKLKIKYSEWKDPKWKNHHIKISSELLGRAFDWLECGKNCYEMNIPKQILFSNKEFRLEVLKGLFRGDGGVSTENTICTYRKKDKKYMHKSNSLEISYFTSSTSLFEQVQLLLREQGIINSLEKRKGLLRIKTVEAYKKTKSWFLGEKKAKIEAYLKNQKKILDYKHIKTNKNTITINISSITKKKTKEEVYSLEVEPNKTIITDGGLIAHNCIPLDPFYLTFAAKKVGMYTRFIELAGQVNRRKPAKVVEKIKDILNQEEKSLKGSKILLIGISYKGNVADTRESPALEILKLLKEKQAIINFYDPYAKKIKDFEQIKAKLSDEETKSIELTEANLQEQDLIIITTKHDCINWQFVLENSKLIYDTRNAYKDFESIKIIRGFEL